jgi:hypothetical protein
VLGIGVLTWRDEFFMDKSVSVEKKQIDMGFTLLLTSRFFFGRSEEGYFH